MSLTFRLKDNVRKMWGKNLKMSLKLDLKYEG